MWYPYCFGQSLSDNANADHLVTVTPDDSAGDSVFHNHIFAYIFKSMEKTKTCITYLSNMMHCHTRVRLSETPGPSSAPSPCTDNACHIYMTSLRSNAGGQRSQFSGTVPCTCPVWVMNVSPRCIHRTRCSIPTSLTLTSSAFSYVQTFPFNWNQFPLIASRALRQNMLRCADDMFEARACHTKLV